MDEDGPGVFRVQPREANCGLPASGSVTDTSLQSAAVHCGSAATAVTANDPLLQKFFPQWAES